MLLYICEGEILCALSIAITIDLSILQLQANAIAIADLHRFRQNQYIYTRYQDVMLSWDLQILIIIWENGGTWNRNNKHVDVQSELMGRN